jgi:hypothetical protein
MKTAHYFLWMGLGIFLTSAHAEEATSIPDGQQKNATTSLEKIVFSSDSSASSIY